MIWLYKNVMILFLLDILVFIRLIVHSRNSFTGLAIKNSYLIMSGHVLSVSEDGGLLIVNPKLEHQFSTLSLWIVFILMLFIYLTVVASINIFSHASMHSLVGLKRFRWSESQPR